MEYFRHRLSAHKVELDNLDFDDNGDENEIAGNEENGEHRVLRSET